MYFGIQAPALALAWTLDGGCALALQPRQKGVLQVTGGRIWLTCDVSGEALHGSEAQASDPRESGDIFISAGEEISLRAGQRVLIESFAPRADRSGAELRWVPDGWAAQLAKRPAVGKSGPLPSGACAA